MNLLVAGWSSGLQEMADQIYADGGFVSVYEEALADIGEATQRYEQELDILRNQYGDVFDGLGQSADASAEKINNLIGTTSTLITTYNEEVVAIKNLVNQYSDMVPVRISDTCVAMRDKDVYDPLQAKAWETVSVNSIDDIVASAEAA